MSSKEIENRKKVLQKLQQNPHLKPFHIAKELKMSPSTVYGIINRFKDTFSVNRKKGGGRKKGFADQKLERKIVRSLKAHPQLSDNDRAKKYGTSRATVIRVRRAHNFKTYRAKKNHNRTEKQGKYVKLRARKLYDDILTKFSGCILMDDETYVKLDFNQLPGQKFYVAINKRNVKPQYKYIFMDKFSKKMMIWQAICSCGRKSSVFVTSQTMTSKLYIEECLEKRILPLIKLHKNAVMFWPDLASVHYSGMTLNWLEQHGVSFVPKSCNPPNCPQFRPIERFWAIVKGILRRTGGRALNAKSLLIKWNNAADKVTKKTVQTIMGSINRRVRNFLRANEEI